MLFFVLFKRKILNISYNDSYNYKEKALRFSLHFLQRKKTRNINLNLVRETIKTGRINKRKSYKNKLCIERYFGKTNQKYIVVVVLYPNHIKVKTVWVKKGN